MKLNRIAILLALTLGVAACSNNATDTTDDLPDDPQGTIIGNPTPPPGTLKISSTDGRLRFIVNIYERGRATATRLDDRGNVTGTANGGFALVPSTSSPALSISNPPPSGGQRFDSDFSFPDGEKLSVALTMSATKEVVTVEIRINDAPVRFAVVFTMEGGKIAFTGCGENGTSSSRDEPGQPQLGETQGCGENGTSSSRNEPEQPQSEGSCGITPSVDDLKQVLCEKVHTCRPTIGYEECLVELERVSITDEFGLAEDEMVIFASIRALLEMGFIEFNNDRYCSCRQRIVEVTCESIDGSYITSLDELGELEEVIPQECGNDEYPGIFLPDEFSIRTESAEPSVDSVINALCTTVSECDSEISFMECQNALEEGLAADIWDEFGLSGPFEGAPADLIRIAIEEGVVTVDATELDHCINEHLLDEITDSCDYSGGSLTNMENYADNCELVFWEN